MLRWKGKKQNPNRGDKLIYACMSYHIFKLSAPHHQDALQQSFGFFFLKTLWIKKKNNNYIFPLCLSHFAFTLVKAWVLLRTLFGKQNVHVSNHLLYVKHGLSTHSLCTLCLQGFNKVQVLFLKSWKWTNKVCFPQIISFKYFAFLISRGLIFFRVWLSATCPSQALGNIGSLYCLTLQPPQFRFNSFQSISSTWAHSYYLWLCIHLFKSALVQL